VQYIDAILDELVRRDLLRILALLDQPALDAVLHVRELHAAVADRAATMLGEVERMRAHGRRDRDALALQQAHVAVDIADDLDLRRRTGILVNQIPDRRTETRRQTARRQNADLLHLLAHHLSL